MPVHSITKPSCSSCQAPLSERHYLTDLSGRGLGLVCDHCRELAEGRKEVIFHGFGGMHGNEGRAFDAKEPWYVPSLDSVDQLRVVAFDCVIRNPYLKSHLALVDQAALEVAA